MGEEIDNFDIVVRIHHWHIHREPEYERHLPEHEHLAISEARYVPPFYQRRVGSRTHVLYWRLQWMDYGTLTSVLDALRKFDSTDWIGVDIFAEMAYAAPQHHYIEQYWGPVHVIPIEFFNALAERLHFAEPLPGTVVTAFLASLQPRRVKLFGLPCYQDVDGKAEHAKLAIMGKHNTLTDFYFIRQLVERDERIECDRS